MVYVVWFIIWRKRRLTCSLFWVVFVFGCLMYGYMWQMWGLYGVYGMQDKERYNVVMAKDKWGKWFMYVVMGKRKGDIMTKCGKG